MLRSAAVKAKASKSNNSPIFQRLVQGLKQQGKTCTVIESSCGGLIQSSLMSVPGSSAVYYGGSVAYNTKHSKPFLMKSSTLHEKLLNIPKINEAEDYIRSKQEWTAETAVAFCEECNVDFAIAEGGATGPTFRPPNLQTGFSVICIAGKPTPESPVQVLAQTTFRSTHNDRQRNMREFADQAAQLALQTILGEEEQPPQSTAEVTDGHYHCYLDRATHIRTDAKALAVMEQRADAKHVILKHATESLFLSHEKLAIISNLVIPPTISKTFLGVDPDGVPVFSIDIQQQKDNNKDENAVPEWLTLPEGAYFAPTRSYAPLLAGDHLELAMAATAFAQWRRTHKFCSTCGQPLVAIDGGTCLKCQGCQEQWWPRQDPSIIVLVTNPAGDKALLARSPRHPPKVHTALAGFIEAGEPFEAAVMREVYEETGITVDPHSIQYLSSQPWPFPRSCMVGFRATADPSQTINIDPNEIVSADWFSKEQVLAAAKVPGAILNPEVAKAALIDNPSLNVLIPSQGVLARSLIDSWLYE